MRRLLYIFLFLIPFTADTAALMTGKVFIDINLLDAPSNSGNIIEKLNADTPITIQQRQSRWSQVETAANTGWVPTLTIRIVSVTQQSNIDGATDVITERLGGVGTKKTVVATFGIRGIDEESLKGGELSEEQLSLLESYKVSKNEAAQFSRSADLKSKNVDYFGVTVEIEQ
ncbi:MAG: SH3 domain-containing protein [Proteobacteria bacterium]|nr:SH3 domain-containing protein [Pseudomonadota bacterium]